MTNLCDHPYPSPTDLALALLKAVAGTGVTLTRADVFAAAEAAGCDPEALYSYLVDASFAYRPPAPVSR